MGARASVGGQLPNAARARMVRGEEGNERGDIERKRGAHLAGLVGVAADREQAGPAGPDVPGDVRDAGAVDEKLWGKENSVPVSTARIYAWSATYAMRGGQRT